jgi:hypothetical protein
VRRDWKRDCDEGVLQVKTYPRFCTASITPDVYGESRSRVFPRRSARRLLRDRASPAFSHLRRNEVVVLAARTRNAQASKSTLARKTLFLSATLADALGNVLLLAQVDASTPALGMI